MQIITHLCAKDHVLPLVYGQNSNLSSHENLNPIYQHVPVGTHLLQDDEIFFTVVGRILIPSLASTLNDQHAKYCLLLKAAKDIESGQKLNLRTQRQGYSLAWITLSDKGSIGQREDKSGPLIGQMLNQNLALCHEQGFLLPDDGNGLRSLLLELAFGQGYDLICTTGGTGLGPRDVTPQAMLQTIDIRLTGFEQMMMQASLQKTPNAALSRAMVGLIGTCLCVNLPGSAKAVKENLEAILPALPHALEKINVQGVDCGG